MSWSIRLPAAYAVALYRQRWRIEIVFTQMTKTDVLALGAERDHVADLRLVVGDHHPVDEKLHELALLLECSLSDPGTHPLAEALDRADPAGELRLMVYFGFQLLNLDLQDLGLLSELSAPTLMLGQREHTAQR